MDCRHIIFILVFIPLLLAAPLKADDLEFDEEGNIEVDPKVENTYDMPGVSAGFNWDAQSNRVRGIMTVEVRDDIYVKYLPYLNTFPLKIDAGVGEDLLAITLNVRWTSIIEFSSGISYGYEFEHQKPTAGVNFLVTKF